MEGSLNSFKFYLQATHKLNSVCKEGNILADNVIEEAEKLLFLGILVKKT